LIKINLLDSHEKNFHKNLLLIKLVGAKIKKLKILQIYNFDFYFNFFDFSLIFFVFAPTILINSKFLWKFFSKKSLKLILKE